MSAVRSSSSQADSLVQLDPTAILMEDNARFSNEVSSEEAAQMCASILDVGRVMEPVGVTVLDTPVNGYTHKLRYGFRRVAGAKLANDQGAGITVPALILHEADTVGTLKEQVAENVVRKSLSLMDIATAARKMLDAGLSRSAVRDVFTRPVGTKGGGVQPASNAWLNMVLGLLELPESIQARVHTNDIGLAAAYRLMKAPPDKRQAILEAAEKIQADIRANEEKEEKQFTVLEEKVKEAEAGVETAVASAEQLKAAVEVSEQNVEAKKQAARDLFKKKQDAESAVKKAKNPEAKEKAKALLTKATESCKAAEVDVKTAEGRLAADQKSLDKETDKQKKFSTTAADLRKKLEEKRAAVKPKKAAPKKEATGISPKAIEQASKAAGVEQGKKKLTGPEMRKTIDELKLVTSYPKVSAIGTAIAECFDSTTTPGQMIKKLAAITGELKAAPTSKK